MELKVTENWVNHLSMMTNENRHTERLIEIARVCEKQSDGIYPAIFKHLRDLLHENLSEHLKIGQLTLKLGIQVNAYALYLRKAIKDCFDNGEQVVETIRP